MAQATAAGVRMRPGRVYMMEFKVIFVIGIVVERIMAVEQKDRQSTFWMKMKERTGIQTGVQMMHRM